MGKIDKSFNLTVLLQGSVTMQKATGLKKAKHNTCLANKSLNDTLPQG